jgi:HAE1 family hydrophobic/amphiphilic exporter-1
LIPILRKELAQIPGIQAFPSPLPKVGGRRGEPLQFKLTGPELGKVASLADALLERLVAHPELGEVDLDLQLNLP